MTDILDEFRLALPANRRVSGTGWINVCCPACGDRRFRGGASFTPTGGWRYSCFNGGCEFNSQPTGWEPGNGFGGRSRKLFELMGGDVRRIPLAERMRWSTTKFSADGSIIDKGEELDVVHTFPEVELPEGSMLLKSLYERNTTAQKVMKYAHKRFGSDFCNTFPLYWTEKHPYYVIMPYFHYKDKIVGYLGRHIYHTSGAKRFIQRAPNDYLFNQHLLSTYSARYLFVVESPMDAALLGCVAARNDRLTERQINLLKVSGKDIVMVPDCKVGESSEFVRQAEAQKWFISVPEWTGKTNPAALKTTDIGRSITKDGLLFTIELLMKRTTRNYVTAKTTLNMVSV